MAAVTPIRGSFNTVLVESYLTRYFTEAPVVAVTVPSATTVGPVSVNTSGTTAGVPAVAAAICELFIF